ncbi:hypothetical protein [Agarilytica rhodophyticola]|uniref:hypothetical protein n=1 Tax=Agarilytica rhodophyticola TaxID=1737490 RepID=UPI001C1F9C6B|nr:hypothetical protein [Agarilytica rhodophyticola]
MSINVYRKLYDRANTLALLQLDGVTKIKTVKKIRKSKWIKEIVATLFIVVNVSYVNATEKKIDQRTGLIIDENWQIIAGNCSACHSLSLVKTNRANKQGWLSMIRWMQETQNLWKFDTATEEKILRYLTKNYGPDKIGRRRNLPTHLLPPSSQPVSKP